MKNWKDRLKSVEHDDFNAMESRDDSPPDQFGDFQWRRRWDRPPKIVLIGTWIFNGAGVLLGFALACGLIYQSAAAVPQEPIAVLGIVAGVGIAIFFYYIFARPLLNIHRYFMSFNPRQNDLEDSASVKKEQQD